MFWQIKLKQIKLLSFFLLLVLSTFMTSFHRLGLSSAELEIVLPKKLFSSQGLQQILTNGSYAMIESTPIDSLGMSEDIKKIRFKALDKRLLETGLPHKQIIGSYEGVVTPYSFFVINKSGKSLTEFKRQLFKLAKEFGQESILLHASGVNYLVFVTGEKKGRSYSGIGIENDTRGDFSIIEVDNKKIRIGKYKLNKNHLSSIHQEFQDLI